MESKDREIARLLAAKGISWNDLSNKKIELIRKVYDITVPKLEKLAELSQQIEVLKFGKQSISEELGINRKTLGSNNPEVSALIDLLVKKGQAYWGASKTKNKPSEEIEELKKKLELLYARDVELVQKNNEILGLKKEIEARKKQYEKLKKEKEELERNNREQALEFSKKLTPIIGKKGGNAN